jgi:hypothetical protein
MRFVFGLDSNTNCNSLKRRRNLREQLIVLNASTLGNNDRIRTAAAQLLHEQRQ